MLTLQGLHVLAIETVRLFQKLRLVVGGHRLVLPLRLCHQQSRSLKTIPDGQCLVRAGLRVGADERTPDGMQKKYMLLYPSSWQAPRPLRRAACRILALAGRRAPAGVAAEGGMLNHWRWDEAEAAGKTPFGLLLYA